MAENSDRAGIVGSVTSNANVPAVGNVPDAGIVPADHISGGTQPDGSNRLGTNSNVKKTSFQITSVTVDSSASNDGGDDSADDLDESHTEDSSTTDLSRHTSESRGGGHSTNDENFTRNDIFYNPAPPSSMNIAPVIPTSFQYGLAIVPEGIDANAAPAEPPPPPIINDSEKTDSDIVHNRFKVVKIVSTEPFKKGRWMCMDYLDHTTTGSTASKDTTITQPPQSQPQVPPSLQQDKMNVIHQGTNLASSPPMTGNPGMDTQQQTIIQQPTKHVIQSQNPKHETDMHSTGPPNGSHYHVNHHSSVNDGVQGSMGQQYFNNTGVISGMGSVAPNIPSQQFTTQMHPAPPQVTQTTHLTGASLPHGNQMNANTFSNNPPSAPAPQQHTTQSLGHDMLQQATFMNAQQHQPATMTHQFQQPPPPQQQQQQLISQPVMGNMQNASVGQQQNAPTRQQQQQQPNSYQQNVMMQNMTGMQQQVHPQQMNPASVSQHSVPIQQAQQGQQAQGIYTAPGQLMGHNMQIPGQQMSMQQASQSMMQQQNVIQNQTMMQPQQQQMVGQQHHQQMMNMAQQQQPIVSQPPTSVPQQTMMSQPQMMSQMMQNTQMSGMVSQQPLQTQQGGLPPQQGMSMQPQTSMAQQTMIQQMTQQQPNYPSQPQPQTISNQVSMQQQPLMQQYPQQQQTNPAVQQQQMIQSQNQSNIMAQQMGQSIAAGQGQQIIQQQSQPPQQAPVQQQQQAPPQVSIPSQPQQNVYQNTPPQPIQVSQANAVQNMANMQAVHNIIQQQQQQQQQIPTSAGVPLQGSSVESLVSNSSMASSEPPPQQQPHVQQTQPLVQQPQPIVQQPPPVVQQTQPQPIVQQQSAPPVSLPNPTQVQPAPPPSVPSPAEVHLSSQQSAPTSVQTPSVTTSAAAAAITSLSAAATVIIDGVNSLGEAAVASGAKEGNEDGESATGTNTVAIDNKIEQAMDLVKSHLMFAVREEVEVLKEKISELMERISQLEYENTILRANATPETLAQLQKTAQHPAPNANESHQGFS